MIVDPAVSIVLATRNQGKVRELASLLVPFKLTVLGLEAFPYIGDIEETGATFTENALIKASTVSLGTGLVAIADDSGLAVDFLGGAPGVYSARYSETPECPATDEGNVRKLLAALAGVPQAGRTARFHCCMAACAPGGESITAEAAWEGLIALAPSGSGGFGYDPVFFDPAKGKTAAEMSPEEKDSRSHRAKAVGALLLKWPAFQQAWPFGG
jgi:XTP/dITP diphosphohydrolase